MNEQQKEKNILHWKQGSLNDLQAAVDIASLARKNSHALFFLHLSVEKALKAFFVYKFSAFAPLSHNLLMLCERCEIGLDEDQSKLISEINDFNLEMRYPNEIDELEKLATDSFTQSYLTNGAKIQKWILEKLK